MSEHFKVVIAGAGPVGLVLAYALSAAAIDFVCLDKRCTLFEDAGASLVLLPHTLRVLSQFGIYNELMALGTKVQKHTTNIASTNERWDSSGLSEVMEESHGMPPLAFHRAQLIRCLFDGLPQQAKSKILTAKQIINIENSNTGVDVSCNDGTSYDGSIVIGADGAHSLTRRIMHRITTSNFPGLDWDPVRPYKSEYTCLWFTCPQRAEPGQYIETQSSSRSAIIMTGKEKEWVILFEKHTPQSGDIQKYSLDEVEQFAASFAELPTSLGESVGDMFARRITAGMTDLDEGIVEHWYSDRMVLVGDACHKMTPNAGIGFNSGVQDVAVLCNNLRKLIKDSPASMPCSDAVTSAFEKYQLAREAAARQDVSFSMHLTRIQAWASLTYWVLAYWVLSYGFVKRLLAHYVCSGYSRGEIISYIPAKDMFCGRVPWVNTMPLNNDQS
ncbi:hypothetical protein MBLNU13_g05413t4 [Cladosporium sp. NU13]